MRSSLVGVAIAAFLSLAVSCGGQESVLEQGARFPDDEGVATEVTLERIEVDGKRAYRVADRIESFTTRSHEVTPLLFWKGKYVHLGLNDADEIVWVAGIGAVVKAEPSYTIYTGIFERLDRERRRAVFEDGTTLKLDDQVELPNPGTDSVATIDPAKHVATRIDPA